MEGCDGATSSWFGLDERCRNQEMACSSGIQAVEGCGSCGLILMGPMNIGEKTETRIRKPPRRQRTPATLFTVCVGQQPQGFYLGRLLGTGSIECGVVEPQLTASVTTGPSWVASVMEE
jgi:hypothetical protein